MEEINKKTGNSFNDTIAIIVKVVIITLQNYWQNCQLIKSKLIKESFNKPIDHLITFKFYG